MRRYGIGLLRCSSSLCLLYAYCRDWRDTDERALSSWPVYRRTWLRRVDSEEEEAGSDVFAMQDTVREQNWKFVCPNRFKKKTMSAMEQRLTFSSYTLSQKKFTGIYRIAALFCRARDTRTPEFTCRFRKWVPHPRKGCQITLNACHVPGAHMLRQGQGAPIFTQDINVTRWGA